MCTERLSSVLEENVTPGCIRRLSGHKAALSQIQNAGHPCNAKLSRFLQKQVVGWGGVGGLFQTPKRDKDIIMKSKSWPSIVLYFV